MATGYGQEIPRWYVLNYIGNSSCSQARKVVDRYNSSTHAGLELFAPTYVVKEDRQGELKLRTVNLTFHYVFVRGLFDHVKQLCGLSNGFSFLIDRGSDERYAVIDDDRMMYFQNIARAYRNCLPFFSLDDIDLEAADLVEVVRGDFPGLVGHYMPNPRSKTGNIVLSVYNNVGTIAFNVKATDVRVLEFSHQSTRANDQIDAFVPNLLKALRCYDRNEALTPALIAKLAVFCGRMGVARLNNRKLDARLQILLYAANHILGNTAEAAAALAKYQIVQDSVTNHWTRALITLILAIITRDRTLLSPTYSPLTTIDTASKAQQMVLEEYHYYILRH